MKFLLSAFGIALHICAAAQTLQFKSDYGNAGVVRTNLSNDAPYYAFATGKQSDGKLIIGGSTLIRTLTNGTVDSSFGTNGLAMKADYLQINTLAVQADDKIVCILNDNSQVILRRFTAAGKPDSSFNNTGIAYLSEAGKILNISRVRLQPDGKILLAGSSFSSEKNSFFIARYLADGTPDLTFNSTGSNTLDLSVWHNVANDIAAQSSGQLIVAGYTTGVVEGSHSLTVIRLNADGSPDNDFNTTGIVQYSDAIASFVKIYADDKILIAGYSTDQQLLLMRLLPHGATDASFNTTGIVTEAGLGYTQPKQLEILSGNNILVSGESTATSTPNWDYAAFKYDNSGAPLASFNGTGKSYLSYSGNDYSAGSIVLGDGSILICGYNDNAVFANTAKINSSGVFDNAYGTSGIKSLKINGTDETVYSIVRQTSNKLIAIGPKTNIMASVYNTALVRYNTNGTIDNTFGTDGVFTITEEGFIFHSAIVQADNKIVLLGDKPGTEPNFIPSLCVIRINANGGLDNTFGTSGVVLLSSAITSGYGKGLAQDGNNRIIVAGADATNSNNIVAYRLNTSGTLHTSFGTSGKRTISLGYETVGLGAIAVQSDNKVLLGGYLVESGGASAFFCVRLGTNGTNDTGFGSSGVYKTPASVSNDFIDLNAVLPTYNNKILLSGYVNNPSDLSSSVYVVRLLTGGTEDASFNGTGIKTFYKTLNDDSTFLIPNSMEVHPDSSVYIVGDAVNISSEFSPFIIRIKTNGTIDSTLSTDGSGMYRNKYNGIDCSLNDIFISTDSIVYVTGSVDDIGTNSNFLIAAHKRLPEIQGTVYIFNGNGLWTTASNWLNSTIPPANLPNGASIIIAPSVGGSCTLNINQVILPGGKMTVNNGAQLFIQGNFKNGN